VAGYLRPFVAHELAESYQLVDDEATRAGVLAAKEGRYDEALAAWTQVYEADGKNHGALYNAAVIHIVKGYDRKALELLLRATSIEDKLLYRSVLGGVKARVGARREVGAAPDP
jgi:tetratricopeptide (TPR) repeat protein